MSGRREATAGTPHGAPAVANSVSGTVTGDVFQVRDVNLLTGSPVRTRYRQQVARIAPAELVGREAELAELAEFCTSAGTAGAYRWWRADPWSGKSALLSWFVLDPPPGVRVVSFFITARLAAQNDRNAFIDNVLEQLVTLLDQDLPPFLTEATREAHLLGLLAEAAHACRARGEHFVLVVDGLDEDRGVTTRPDAHSVAALLPARPPAGMRVVVAGRPNPPIPADVPGHHPLREPGVVRVLSPSPKAQAERADMERELKRLLHGSALEQDLLGLLAAAGGGLTAADLATLSGASTWEVEDHLTTVTGRSFARRAGDHRLGDPTDVYLLTHEELQRKTVQMLGRSLTAYRDRVHAWADDHRARDWPADTPTYLLHGYHAMLVAAGDTPRLLACATDPARHDRLRDRFGGDVAAMAEIGAASQALADETDLVAVSRLAVHRDRLTDRNAHVPPVLPALWALVGNPDRAEALARSLPDRDTQSLALRQLVQALCRRGDLDRAESVAESVADTASFFAALVAITEEALARGASDRVRRLLAMAARRVRTGPPKQRDSDLTATVKLLLKTGDLDRAEAVAGTIADDRERAAAAQRVLRHRGDAGVLKHRGDPGVRKPVPAPPERDAAEVVRGAPAPIAGAADPVTEFAADPTRANRELRAALRAAADDPHRVTRLLHRAEESARAVPGKSRRDLAMHLVVKAMATAGHPGRAGGLARAITSGIRRGDACLAVVRAAVAAGEPAVAEPLLDVLKGHPGYELALATVVRAVAALDVERAGALLLKAERSAKARADAWPKPRLLMPLVEAVLATGDLAEAEARALAVSDPALRCEAMQRMAHPVHRSDPAQARRLLAHAAAARDQVTRRTAHKHGAHQRLRIGPEREEADPPADDPPADSEFVRIEDAARRAAQDEHRQAQRTVLGQVDWSAAGVASTYPGWHSAIPRLCREHPEVLPAILGEIDSIARCERSATPD
ncbi:hypothetical protein FHS29_002927 [Saccharothrix tamanrassetensis]|uniref:Uncharacterized protein n=1 Tax=Saccharothrix tamanrassetensis TaxID=1051531 RepID=A0A841CG71_9PSEU|nr:hypothetical protein [Saccharothrix tamanrassetensis]MBB5956341.1 hypothetical protein [Saccharothrix tamanrassetensis]